MEKRIYTVTQINNMVKVAIESNLPGRLSVAGEITSYRPAAGGHKYFTIKDENSQLPSVMWRSMAAKSKFTFANGIAVIATGYIEAYPPFGKYQFIVDTINLAGIGNLRLIFEQLVAKLEAEGLFDARHKKPLPPYPMRIGIVTSPTGAAIEDINDSIRRRFPCAKLFLYPVTVQGKGAAEKIAAAIGDINNRNNELRLDLLIVGRGGGSLEDLWCFNEEITARAIFASKVPIISAVGHEIDTTIADLVADARASTPTKAGVIAVPDIAELNEQINTIKRRLGIDITNKIELSKQKLATLLASAAFRNPSYVAAVKSQRVDELQWRLKDGFAVKLSSAAIALENCRRKINSIEPHNLVSRKYLDLQRHESRIAADFYKILNNSKLSLTAAENRLKNLDPRQILTRGYTITRLASDGKVLTGAARLSEGDMLKTEFSGGKSVKSKVVSPPLSKMD